MDSFQKHYFNIIQKDLILSENLSTVSELSGLKKIKVCIGGNSSKEDYVIASLAALKIITDQTPYFTQQNFTQQRLNSVKEGVGGKLTLRRQKMYSFLYKLLFEVLPQIKQFEGLQAPAHKKVYCFVLKDIFSFKELVPLFPYLEGLNNLQCQFHFTTNTNAEVAVLGNSLQLCFLPSNK